MTRQLMIHALAAGALLAETPKAAETPLARDTQLELQLIVLQERAANEKLQAVAELLLAPIREAKQAAMEKACKSAGIPVLGPDGRPGCEIDLKEGKVRKVESK